ncbi:ribbon-helix-helix domain-containing protein [Novosphingobium sp. KCTC 2891]|uniref:CopG family ribbon-helix-helix protein n=1 Tax=Novosphingobium sp. KCTC 2891 TaxID=2989730 RepID=UPI0022212D54|nr:ribbon-helix-helix domain-containing protein [Novosphingobium sp. KCTC 2891]MCW1382700.1 ribbon-helix-helix domain-containing protein [Novosphingobium sp. KCTC 2891]
MTRVLIDLPDSDLEAFDALARRNGRSRAAEMREAVRLYLQGRAGDDWVARGLGYWQDRTEMADGLAFQHRQRRSGGGGR